MDHVGSLLPKILQKRGLMGQASSALVTHHARVWIAEHLSAMADCLQIATFKDGELMILASHSIAAQECQQSADVLLQYLREDCSHLDVQRVRVGRQTS